MNKIKYSFIMSCIFFFSGCTIIIPGGYVAVSPGGGPSPTNSNLREYRAVFHCHSYLSHDSEGTIEEISTAANELGFNIVFLNDHYAKGNIGKSPRGIYNGVLFIPGVETRFPRSKDKRFRKKASVLAVDLKRDYKKGLSYKDKIKEFTNQNSFLVAGHVERLPPDYDLTPFQGFEVYNLHAEFSHACRLLILWRFLFYPLDCFLEGTISYPQQQISRWDKELMSGKRLTPLAGHDAHANITILWRTVNDYPPNMRLFSNRILAPRLDKKSIMEALKQGHVYISFDYLGDPKGFSMRYGFPKGQWSIMGDKTSYEPDKVLEIDVPEEVNLRILCNGKEIWSQEGWQFKFTPPGPGIYRAEIYKNGSLWILPAPLYIR